MARARPLAAALCATMAAAQRNVTAFPDDDNPVAGDVPASAGVCSGSDAAPCNYNGRCVGPIPARAPTGEYVVYFIAVLPPPGSCP